MDAPVGRPGRARVEARLLRHAPRAPAARRHDPEVGVVARVRRERDLGAAGRIRRQQAVGAHLRQHRHAPAVHVDGADLVRAAAAHRERDARAEDAALAGERLHDVVRELVDGVADVGVAVALGQRRPVAARDDEDACLRAAPPDAFILMTACAPTCVQSADENPRPSLCSCAGNDAGSSTWNSPVMSMSFDIVSTAAAPESPSARGTASCSISTPAPERVIAGRSSSPAGVWARAAPVAAVRIDAASTPAQRGCPITLCTRA